MPELPITEPMDEQNLIDRIRQASTPLVPRPTNCAARIQSLTGIRAVVFDIYGTLLISGSGDVGTSSSEARPRAFQEALAAVNLAETAGNRLSFDDLLAMIRMHHEHHRQRGIDYPEVDIVEVWRGLLERAEIGEPFDAVRLRRLAVEFELRANPTWPMPNCLQTLERLNRAGVTLGIVSNAQFFTRLLFPAHLDRSIESLGFREELSLFSYEHLRAKPGLWLYERLVERLSHVGIEPHQVLYVGNDMRNDVWPAARLGLRTALFAGDQRSLRLRESDAEVQGLRPDVIIQDLAELTGCLWDSG